MAFSWPIFIVVLLLGILQVAMGVIIGRTLPLSPSKRSQTVERRAGHLVQLASRLFRLVNSVAADVDRHQARMKQVGTDLAMAQSGGGGQLAELVLKTVAEIVQVNERLQNRLSAAENKLQQQAKRIESHLKEARTDPLTGLPNRRAFDDALSRRIAEWKRRRSVFCLILLDVDHFKAVNDRYGHPAGDEALRSLVKVINRSVNEMNLVARLGGEEFAVILPSTNSDDAMRAAERLRVAVAAVPHRVARHTEISITVSLGLAVIETGDDSISILRRADEALYMSKRTGRNCGHFHDGVTCQPISLASETAAGDDLGDAAPQRAEVVAAEIQSACDNLRERLAELTEQT